MVTDNTSQADDTTAFLRAARSGNLEKVIEFLDTDLDINTSNSNGLNALHLASKDGHVEIVTELLKRGAKVDAATKKGNTALHTASLAGQAEVVKILIQYGAAVNIQSQNGFTPLYMAAQENHDQVVKLLLGNGANQSLATEDGFTPLAVAMQQGHDKVVSVLLENDSKGKVRLPALHIAAKKDDCEAANLLLQNDHKPDVTSKSGFTPLHIAAHYGNEEIARLLIKRGADVNYLAKHNISPLHVAAKWGKNNMVKVLLENSAQIDAKTRDGLTPLHCAARSGHEKVVTTLLENSAPISARTKNGLAPLHMASQGDHVDAARVLLYHRAPVDEVTIDYLTSLHVAAHCGHVRVAKLLLDRKADPNARALNGFTPLHIACKKNRIKVVELLLKHGASIESTTESGLTPLHVASFMGCMNIVIFLLQHEANPDVPTVRGETPLHLAARANQTDIIRILLRNGAKVDARAREQQTPLHIASRLGNIDIVMLLLQHGAAVDTTTKDMYTALHIAAKEGQEEVATILVENNASLKATTKNGFTPLHIAAKYGNMNVAKILLQKDSKLDAQGKNDISPLHLACHYDHPNVANLLLEKGASPHLASQNGHTPLHIAARKNQMDIASTLLENGANANAESKAGFTPLHLSAQKGHYDMTNLLIEHGADPNHKAKNGLTALHLCAQEDFIRVASILVKNGADVESKTETGYRPIHVAAHFGNLSMIRFLLKHDADIDVRTNQNYTPLHQAAQQGHAHIVTALLEGNASHKARTNDGLTALNIAQKLGYISVMEVLKGLTYDTLTPDNKNWEEKYKVIAPESLQETSFMSDSDDEGGSDALMSEQPYRYLTADLMKSLRDDSLPIDVTRDDPIHGQVTKEEKQEFAESNNYCMAENFDSTDGLNLGRLHFRSFLVSFLVDARGGAMKGCRHSGVRIIVPPRRATMPIRVTCRLVKPSKVANPPPLMEGEALATRIIEMGPVDATFLGPVLIDIPHFASVRGKEREIIILRSDNGETWKEHDNSAENDDTLMNTPYDAQMSATHSGRITRILTTDFPQYFAIVTRIKQEVHVIGAEGGILISSVANHVQAVFPPGALTKKIKVGLQAHVIPAELTAKLLGNCVAVSPVITIEPRRRKFHKPITLTIPVPQAANKGMINQYGGETPTLRLLCSIAGGTSESQWEDVTGSTPLTFMNDRVSFTTTVSARFWLMDCRNIGAVPKMATELYEESLFVPYNTNFVIYSKRIDVLEATLRILCMTDGKEGMHTLEKQEEFLEIVKSRDVEALDGKDLYIEFSGNLVPVTKSGVQLKFTFKAFRQNRLSFHVKVKDPLLDPVARMLFMREPKVAKGEPPQQPICVLNIVLPEMTTKVDIEKKIDYEDSNIITQKMDFYKSKYRAEQKEKCDEPKETSPSEKKFITDTLQKEQTDAATIHESLAQKAACPLESVDASYPNKAAHGDDLSPSAEKQTYSEKRRFWEDISRKRESYQRSESELSRTSQLTINESDSEYLQNVVSEEDTTEVVSEIGKSETLDDLNVPDISECSVAEKAHYFEEQIQREMAKVPKVQQQDSVKSEKERVVKSTDDMKVVEMTTEKVELEEKHVTESKEVEKVVERAEEVSRKTEEKKEEKTLSRDEEKDIDESTVEEESAQPVHEICKELLNKEREVAQEPLRSTTEITKTEIVEIRKEVVIEKVDRPEKVKETVKEVRVEVKEKAPLREEKVEVEVKKSVDQVEEIERKTGTLEEIIKERKDLSGKVKEFMGDVLTEEAMELPKGTKKVTEVVEQAATVSEKGKTVQTVQEVIKERKEQHEQVEERIMREMKEPMVQKIEEKIVYEIKEPIVKTVEEKVVHEVKEPIVHKIEEKTVHEVKEPVVHKIEEKIVHEVKEPVVHKIEEKLTHEVTEPVVHKIEEKQMHEVTESVTEKVKEQIVEKIVEPATKKVEEVTIERVKKPAVQKVVEIIEHKVEDAAPIEALQPMDVMHEEATKIVEEVVTVAKDLTEKLHEISKEHEQKETKKMIEEEIKVLEPITRTHAETTLIAEEIMRTLKEKPEALRGSTEEIVTEERIQRSGTPESRREDVVREKSSGRRIITEETTIIYKVQKDGTLVQEQILKSVQIEGANGVPVTQGPEVSVETQIFEKGLPEGMYEIQSTSDITNEAVPFADVKKEIRQFLEGERKVQDDERPPSAPEDAKLKTEQGPTTDSLENIPSVQQETRQALETKEEEKKISTEKPLTETEIKQVKKEFESRIPISTAKADKDKLQKEVKPKVSAEMKPTPSESESSKSPSVESMDLASPTAKKKEFESRIPKRVVDTKPADKAAKKDTHPKKESETYTVTEKKSSEEVTSKLEEHSTTKSETQTFSKTFTDPQEAFKMFEDMGSMKKDFATVTSKVDHKTSSTLEKKEVVSSEISTGTDKIITHEEKERVERKKSSETKVKKESPAETLEEKKSKHEEIDKTAVQKMSMNLTDGKEVIDASASESRAESKKEQSLKVLQDKEGVTTRETGSSRLRESDADVAIRIKKDLSGKTDDQDSKTVEDIGEKVSKPVIDSDNIEMIAQGESHKETRESFDVTQFVPSEKPQEQKAPQEKEAEVHEVKKVEVIEPLSLEEQQRQKFKEIEARTIAETLIQSIESEIEKKSAEHLKTELLTKGYLEQLMAETSEADHEKLADDLTRKFETIMRKSLDDQSKDRTEKDSNRDSISISEDITKDEESSIRDKEESFPLSSSQAKLQDRDITMSPISISEQIDFEETMDVDTNELEDVSKPTSSPQSEKLRSDRSSGQVEPLQRDPYSDASFLKDKIVSEISGARVLEILEPGGDSQSRQDSVDVPSLEMDEHKVSEPTSKDITSLRESATIDSLERIAQERDITISPSTVSEDTNVDSSLMHEHPPPLVMPRDYDAGVKRADSFEIESPPMVSPRLKTHGLEIKPVDWMIGDEKIEISETLQPSQVFNQELEAYESSIKKQGRLPSHDGSTDVEQESGTRSSADTSVIESIKETVSGDGRVTTTTITRTTKFTVIPVSEKELESELIENKLDISCQELVDTLQREYDAKTPTEEYAESIRQAMPRQVMELEQQMSEDITEDEESSRIEKPEIAEKSADVAEIKVLDTIPIIRKHSPPVSEEEVVVEKEEEQEVTKEVAEPKAEKTIATTGEEKPVEKAEVTKEEKPAEKVEVTKEEKPVEKAEVTKEEKPIKKAEVTEQEKPVEKAEVAEQEKPAEKEEPSKEAKPIERKETVEEENLAEKEEPAKKEATKEPEKAAEESSKPEVPKTARVDNVLKEWTEAYLSKIKPPSEEYKRHMEKATEKHDRPGRSAAVPSDTCALKIKKDDLPSVDLSARYAITVLDQVVKKEIAEVKESLEAAKQDLIEELNENSETVIQIKDSPSEFQFKLQPESIPNDLPFLYRPPSPEHVSTDRDTETATSESPVAKPRKRATDSSESRVDVEDSISSSFDEQEKLRDEAPVIETEKSETETTIAVHDDTRDEEEGRPSPVPASRSGSDIDNKDESSSLAPPYPVPRRRHKHGRSSRRVTSESEADIGSSSGDSSNYQSCDYEIGSGSRPSSSDVEAMQSCGVPSGTVSEYETAVMSIERSSPTRATSQDYHTAVSTLSSRESMKSLNSLSSGHLGSIDSTSELSETLVASETDVDKEEIDENLECALEEEHAEHSESSGSDMPIDESMDKIDSHVPCRMKRSSEMIFQQIVDDNASLDVESIEEPMSDDAKAVDSATSAFTVQPGALQSVDIMTSRVSEDGMQSVCTQVISTQVTTTVETDLPITDTEAATSGVETLEKDTETITDVQTMEPDSLEPGSSASGVASDSPEVTMQASVLSMMQQASMSTSSTSGMSIETVIEKEKCDRHSPDSDSFELVDKPDIIDDFVVIEEVGREAEEYDSEGKSICISSIPQVTSKNYDRDLENLITENKEDSQVSTSQASRNNELFEFESEESPPQASNDDQYSQSLSDEEQYEGGKKWIEMQFQADARVYDIEYDRGPLEDIKEEEITDFEAGSSRFGSLGSHKESIGSVGSMRGSFGSTPDYDVLAGKKYFTRPTDHDNVSLSSLQEFEHLESTVAAENARKAQCGSQDSINNGSLPRRYVTSRSGHGDDISLSSLKDFEGLERACREAHLIELRAREEEDLLEHESPENRYKLENIARAKTDGSAAGSFNPSTSGSDDYEKRIKEIDEIIRIAQSNVEKIDRQDDTTEDISQIEITDGEKLGSQVSAQPVLEEEEPDDAQPQKEGNVMETSTDSLELEDNADKKHHPLCRSSDSLEMKTTLDFPSLSSDSLNNVRDAKEMQSDAAEQASNVRRISSDSLDMPLLEQQDVETHGRDSESSSSNNHSDRAQSDNSLGQTPSTETNVKNGKTRTTPSSDT